MIKDMERHENEMAHSTDIRIGSGYPSDKITKAWLAESIVPVIGVPDIVRSSWRPVQILLDKHKPKTRYVRGTIRYRETHTKYEQHIV